MTARRADSIEQHLHARLQEKPLLLMAHAVAGYPSLDANRAMLELMEEAGVDIVELQLPFSEPIADGPTFVKANQGAIDAGLHRDDYFELLSWAAGRFSFPLIFMGYYNSIFRMGEGAFCARLREAGGRGFIVADLPVEESDALHEAARREGLDPILIVTPTTTMDRLRRVASEGSGFLYCVARKGVTGRRTDLTTGVDELLARVRSVTSLPLGLGFGLKTPDDVRGVRGRADLAIIGTACLEAWERGGPEGYRKLLRELVDATR